MEMHQVRYFLAVARTLNFTRAAEECNVSQPSLTRAIQKLEDELGGLLFHRERKLTHLTALGRMIQPHFAQMCAAAEAARHTARSLGTAHLAPLNLGLAASLETAEIDDLISRVSNGLPGLQLSLRMASSRSLVEAAMQGAFDLVVVAETEDLPERMDCLLLFRQRVYMVTHAEHPLACASRITLNDVKGEVLIDCNDDATTLFKTAACRTGYTVDFRHSAASFEQARGLISAGLGSAVLAAHGGLPEQLAAIPFDESLPPLRICLASVSGRRRSPASEAFVRAVRTYDWSCGRADRSRVAEVNQPYEGEEEDRTSGTSYGSTRLQKSGAENRQPEFRGGRLTPTDRPFPPDSLTETIIG